MIKDKPIKLKDGTVVKDGMSIFQVENMGIKDRKYADKYDKIITGSGKIRYKLIENEVINVNQSANARTFTVRSPEGCETTYSVRNSCLPDGLHGRKANALKELKMSNQSDLDRVEAKVKKHKEALILWTNCKVKIKKEMRNIK